MFIDIHQILLHTANSYINIKWRLQHSTLAICVRVKQYLYMSWVSNQYWIFLHFRFSECKTILVTIFARPNNVGVYRRKSQYECEITDESTWQEVIFGLLSTVKSQDIVVMSSGRDRVPGQMY